MRGEFFAKGFYNRKGVFTYVIIILHWPKSEYATVATAIRHAMNNGDAAEAASPFHNSLSMQAAV